METYLDLPPIPELLTALGEERTPPLVNTFFIQEGSHTGELLGISATEQTVVMQNDDGVIARIPFAHLRFLEFIQHYQVDLKNSQVLSRVENYHFEFADKKVLQGQTYTHSVDKYGFQFFHINPQGVVDRIFVPVDQVKKHSFEPAKLDENPHEIITKDDVEFASDGDVYTDKKHLIEKFETLSTYLNISAPKYDNQRIGELLVGEGLITSEAVDDALERQRLKPGKKLGEILETMGEISTTQINQKLAKKLGIPRVVLANFDIDHYVLNKVPSELVKRYRLVPLFKYRDRLVLAVDDPLNFDGIDVIRFMSGKTIEVVLAAPDDLTAAIEKYYGSEKDMENDLNIAEEAIRFNEFEPQDLKEAEKMAKEKPLVRLVNGIILDAIKKRASDIHIRPLEDEVHLLYRIDGTLIKIRMFSRTLLPAIISRIKILGRMDVAERRLPQDGRTRVSDKGGMVDLRISVIPTVNGESAVIRLLNKQVGLRSIGELGFNESDQELFVDLLHKNYGMFLVTGPTGSGKSTTLYAALQEIKHQNLNIITVEEPVEYQVSGIEQIQIQTNLGYTFAESLRHILRHDPDVIMVGEVRDVETAKIAVESALTGHLVLSTLHTNSAAGTITRLLEMGVEPYLVSSTLLGVLAQRLVRKNCVHCLDVEDAGKAMRRALKVDDKEVFYKGRGCKECHHTGYSGRMAVYELLSLSSTMRTLVEKATNTTSLHQQAVKDGMVPLTENALKVAREKIISLEEVYRVRLE